MLQTIGDEKTDVSGKLLWIVQDPQLNPESLALTKTIIRSTLLQFKYPEDLNVIVSLEDITIEQIREALAVAVNIPSHDLDMRIEVCQKLELARRSDTIIFYTGDKPIVETFFRDYQARFSHIARHQVLHDKTDAVLFEAIKGVVQEVNVEPDFSEN